MMLARCSQIRQVLPLHACIYRPRFTAVIPSVQRLRLLFTHIHGSSRYRALPNVYIPWPTSASFWSRHNPCAKCCSPWWFTSLAASPHPWLHLHIPIAASPHPWLHLHIPSCISTSLTASSRPWLHFHIIGCISIMHPGCISASLTVSPRALTTNPTVLHGWLLGVVS